MDLKNGYKVIYEKAADKKRAFYASKTGLFEDAELISDEIAIGGYKLIYEKKGKFYGSTTGFPAEEDACLTFLDKVFVEGYVEPNEGQGNQTGSGEPNEGGNSSGSGEGNTENEETTENDMISVDKTSFAPGEPIVVHYKDIVTEDGSKPDWIAIMDAAAGVPSSEGEASKQYAYVEGTGSVTFNAPEGKDGRSALDSDFDRDEYAYSTSVVFYNQPGNNQAENLDCLSEGVYNIYLCDNGDYDVIEDAPVLTITVEAQ
jgi:hypothetical protein